MVSNARKQLVVFLDSRALGPAKKFHRALGSLGMPVLDDLKDAFDTTAQAFGAAHGR